MADAAVIEKALAAACAQTVAGAAGDAIGDGPAPAFVVAPGSTDEAAARDAGGGGA